MFQSYYLFSLQTVLDTERILQCLSGFTTQNQELFFSVHLLEFPENNNNNNEMPQIIFLLRSHSMGGV